ncbi:MAG: hypothetical protein KDB69_00975, partial [Acidimicrobiia bacterium]|nr:hypothetical protein [Acidimicrobiia bacterium]
MRGIARKGHSLDSPPGSTPVYLLDAASDYETEILEQWIGPSAVTVGIRSSRRTRRAGQEGIAEMSGDPSIYLIPLRVLWLPPERKGTRTVRWSDLL